MLLTLHTHQATAVAKNNLKGTYNKSFS